MNSNKLSFNGDNRTRVTLSSIQALRGIAVLLVVLHHTIRAFTVNAPPDWVRPALVDSPGLYETLAIGVDIFFVLSGFVMVFISGKHLGGKGYALEFMTRRILRIYPCYLALTGMLCALLMAQYIFFGQRSFDLALDRVLAALTLFPSLDKVGDVRPILGVGWTLSYEMYFYVVFATSIHFFRKMFFLPMMTIMAIVLFAGRLFSSHAALGQFFSDTIVAEFVFGCAIALMIREYDICKVPGLAACLAAILIVLSAQLPFDQTFRFLYWGVPSALLLYSVVVFEKRGMTWGFELLSKYGDASYSTYLVHVSFIYLIGVPAAAWLHLQNKGPSFVLLVLLCVAALATFSGFVFHWFVEKPFENFFKARLSRL